MSFVYVVPEQPVAFSNRETAVKVAGSEDRISELQVVDFPPEEMHVSPVLSITITVDDIGTVGGVSTKITRQPIHSQDPDDYITSYEESSIGGSVRYLIVEGVKLSEVFRELQEVVETNDLDWDTVTAHLEWYT
jgi:hypothetical protein